MGRYECVSSKLQAYTLCALLLFYIYVYIYIYYNIKYQGEYNLIQEKH